MWSWPRPFDGPTLPSIQRFSALRAEDFLKVLLEGAVQSSLFEEANLVECEHSALPGERLVACGSQLLSSACAHDCEVQVRVATETFDVIARRVAVGRLKVEQIIALKVGAALAQHKMGKHFLLGIFEGRFSYQRKGLSSCLCMGLGHGFGGGG